MRKNLILSGLIVTHLLAMIALSGAQTARVPAANGIVGKHVVGYQGWFSCDVDRRDGRWGRWFDGRNPVNNNVTFDMWPDVSSFPADETCPTSFRLESGQPARVFSSLNPRVVARHARWMAQHDLDVAALQRFVNQFANPDASARVDKVLANVRAAARATGRGYYIMYDISGADPATWTERLLADWRRLVDVERITEDANYLHEQDRPVLAIWGLGFTNRPATPEQTLKLLDDLAAINGVRPFIIGGVPTFWRERTNDQLPDPAWARVQDRLDGLSPWTVGRFGDDIGAARYAARVVAPDLAWARANNKFYLPVIFPGYSFANGGNAPAKLNLIPRRCGRLYWSQVRAAVGLGVQGLYTAMFDEVDEGTAIMPVTPSARDIPANAKAVTLDADGCQLAPTFYLDLAGKATHALRHGIAPPFEQIE